MELLDKACNIAMDAKSKSGKKLTDFKNVLKNDSDFKNRMQALQKEVNDFALKYPMPGFDDH